MTKRQALIYFIENFYTRDEAASFLVRRYHLKEKDAYATLNECPVQFPNKMAQFVKYTPHE